MTWGRPPCFDQQQICVYMYICTCIVISLSLSLSLYPFIPNHERALRHSPGPDAPEDLLREVGSSICSKYYRSTSLPDGRTVALKATFTDGAAIEDNQVQICMIFLRIS